MRQNGDSTLSVGIRVRTTGNWPRVELTVGMKGEVKEVERDGSFRVVYPGLTGYSDGVWHLIHHWDNLVIADKMNQS